MGTGRQKEEYTEHSMVSNCNDKEVMDTIESVNYLKTFMCPLYTNDANVSKL